jgi:site-specific recombinase XerD
LSRRLHSSGFPARAPLLQGGADVRDVRKLLGHQEIDTTAIYTCVASTDLRGVVSLVARSHRREGRDWR